MPIKVKPTNHFKQVLCKGTCCVNFPKSKIFLKVNLRAPTQAINEKFENVLVQISIFLYIRFICN